MQSIFISLTHNLYFADNNRAKRLERENQNPFLNTVCNNFARKKLQKILPKSYYLTVQDCKFNRMYPSFFVNRIILSNLNSNNRE